MMNRHRCIRAALLATLAIALTVPAVFVAARAQTTPPDISPKFLLATDKAPRGRTTSAAVVLNIPAGYHVNAHNPVSKFALPTKLEIDAPGGIKVSPVVYPRATVRRFSFSEDRLGVYENRAMLRFNITVPPDQPTGTTELKAHVTYQSCSNQVCFPPVKRDISIPLEIGTAKDQVKQVNGKVFGSQHKRRRS